MNQFLKYSNLTIQDIEKKVYDYIRSNPDYKNLNETDIMGLFIEIFSGLTDIINYNIQRTAEESVLPTAQKYSSVVSGIHNLNYDISRPIPSKAKIKCIVRLNEPATEEKNITIPQFTKLIFNGLPYLTTEEINLHLSNGQIATESKEIEVFQGRFKTIRFRGNNFQVKNGMNYQKYFIDDPTFSNFYGDFDYEGGDFCLVGISDSVKSAFLEEDKINNSFKNRYKIFRNSIFEDDEMNKALFSEQYQNMIIDEPIKSCLIRTSFQSEGGKGVEIIFGDGNVVSKGINDPNESLYVRYLSTDGKKTNQLGVKGGELKFTDTSKIINDDIPENNITMVLTSNILGGADIESKESIKYNAPGVFQSKKALVTKLDYTSNLKSLTSPINVKNANVWGEQEEIENAKYINDEGLKGIIKLCNVVLVTICGSLYEEDDNNNVLKPKNISESFNSIFIDNDIHNTYFPSQNYLRIMSGDKVLKQLYEQQKTKNKITYDFEINQKDNENWYSIDGGYDSDNGLQNLIINGKYSDFNLDFKIDDEEKSIVINSEEFIEMYTSDYETDGVNKFNYYDDLCSLIQSKVQYDLDDYPNELNETISAKFILENSLRYNEEYMNKIMYYYNNEYTLSSEEENEFEKLKNGEGYPVFFKGYLIFTSNGLNNYYDVKMSGIFNGLEFEGNSTKNYNEDNYTIFNINYLMNYLRDRAQLTVRHLYISPIIHQFKLKGNINIYQGVNVSEVSKNISNIVYKYLDVNYDFDSDLNLSNIVNEINNVDGVRFSNVYFEPYEINNTIKEYKFDMVLDGNSSFYDNIVLSNKDEFVEIINDNLNSFLEKYTITKSITTNLDNEIQIGNKSYTFDSTEKEESGLINERIFFYELVYNIINDMNTKNIKIEGFNVTEHEFFFQIVDIIHHKFINKIKRSMIDENGNIKGKNYSLQNEICQLIIDVGFQI